MNDLPKRCILRTYFIKPSEIHYLRFIIEAYDGIAVVSTIDAALGLVSIAIAPGFEAVVLEIVESEREKLELRDAKADSDLPEPSK